MPAKRKRDILIRFRLTSEESKLLDHRVAASGSTNREVYLRNMALEGYIVKIDFTEVQESLRLVANIANNINQMAKRANETRNIYAEDFQNLYDDVEQLKDQMSDVLAIFNKVRQLYNS